MKFWVENDELSDDWCAFDTLAEAQAFVRQCCVEIADANVDEHGVGNVPAFQGVPHSEIVECLYAEHVGTIEQR